MTEDQEAVHPMARDTSAFGRYLGIRVLSAVPDRIEAEVDVAPDLLNRNDALHGGAMMSVADTLGGLGAAMGLAEGEYTTTVESKTNFLRGVSAGGVLRAVSIPLHSGRKIQVWQTTLYRADGQAAAIVTQTQMTLTKAGR